MWNIFNRLKRQPAPIGLILMYHRVNEAGMDPWSLSVTPEHFAGHLEIIRKQTQPVSLSELAEVTQKKNHLTPDVPLVAVTFDDGYWDNLHYAKPLLEKFEIPATFFITTGNIGSEREFWWDELEQLLLQPGDFPPTLSLQIDGETQTWDLGEATHYSADDYHRDFQLKAWQGQPATRHFLFYSVWKRLQPLPGKERLKLINEIAHWAGVPLKRRETHRILTIPELESLGSGELFEIGAHTITHPLLSTRPVSQQEAEIRQSKTDLEAALQHPVHSFSYPHGDYSDDTTRLIESNGLKYACTTQAEPVRRQQNRFELPRVQVEDWDGETFSKHLQEWFKK